MGKNKKLGLFQGYGVELEYMIVDRDNLEVLPVCDQLLHDVTGRFSNAYEKEGICWSNELALHVVELKTCRPETDLAAVSPLFANDVREINRRLAKYNGCLLPSAAHPWMNPATDGRLWPHGDRSIYHAYDKIFDCRGHGWVNLQSCHLNLPFSGTKEFGRLHAAIRLILPLIPALAASSPFLDGKSAASLDQRLEYYRTNSKRVPAVTGQVIPEPIFTPALYKKNILQQLYRDIQPLDPKGLLQHEWLNARGAIARFDRNAIEIRVIDVQECPRADLAIAAAISIVLQCLVAERWCSHAEQTAWEATPLAAILADSTRDAEKSIIRDQDYLRAFGISAPTAMTAEELWQELLQTAAADYPLAPDLAAALAVITRHGTLARRLLARLGRTPASGALKECYSELAACLQEDRLFVPT